MTAKEDRRVAVVTGGADGLGRGTAERLLHGSYRVAVLDVDDAPALVEAHPDTCSTYVGDVSDRSFVESVAADIASTWGRVDALVNNAGIFPRTAALDLADSDWARVLNVNLWGTFLCAQVFAPAMFEGGGAMVNTASGQAFRPRPNSAAYAASKGGIVSLTRSLAIEWAPHIRVNCVVPGIADTAMPRLGRSEESFQSAGAEIPLGRVGQPSDIASAVAFLVSDDAAYVTGQTLAVNGGSILL